MRIGRRLEKKGRARASPKQLRPVFQGQVTGKVNLGSSDIKPGHGAVCRG